MGTFRSNVRERGHATAASASHDPRMQDPRNLRIHGQALDLALSLYRLTEEFPAPERYGLISQMRRAAVSVGSAMAERCGRNANRALVAALHHALRSFDELEFQMELSQKLGFRPGMAYEDFRNEVPATRRGITALISVLR